MKKDQVPQSVLDVFGYAVAPEGMKEQMEKEIIDIKTGVQTANNDSILIETFMEDKDVGMAALAAENGYRIIVAAPAKLDDHKRMLLDSYGSKFIIMEGEDSMKRAMEKAQELSKETQERGKIIVAAFPETEKEFIPEDQLVE